MPNIPLQSNNCCKISHPPLELEASLPLPIELKASTPLTVEKLIPLSTKKISLESSIDISIKTNLTRCNHPIYNWGEWSTISWSGWIKDGGGLTRSGEVNNGQLCVDVFVNSEDSMMYIIIVCWCTPIEDVCYPFTGCLNCVYILRYNLCCKSGQ